MLQPFITNTLPNTIWRMEIDELTGILVVEMRDQQQKQASFWAIGLQTGNVYYARAVANRC
jgi:hypothetical protein